MADVPTWMIQYDFGRTASRAYTESLATLRLPTAVGAARILEGLRMWFGEDLAAKRWTAAMRGDFSTFLEPERGGSWGVDGLSERRNVFFNSLNRAGNFS